MFKTRTLLSAMAAMGLSWAAGAAQAQDVTLRYSSWVPATYWINADVLYPWFEEIETVTEGRVKVEVLPKTVGTAVSQYDVVRDGLADIAFIIPSYTPGRFVLSEMGNLPFLASDGGVNARAFEKIYRKHFSSFNEFAPVKIMAVYSTVPLTALNNTRPIQKIEDFEGLKLRAPVSMLVPMLTELGAVPIQKSGPESYEMLSTGAIDGQITQVDSTVAFNAVPLMKYATIIPGGMANAVQVVAINDRAWDSISEKDQKAIEEISIGKLAATFGDQYQKREEAGFGKLKEANYQIDVADEAFVEALKKVTAPIEQEWIESAKKKGVEDPAAILAELRAEIKAMAPTQ